MQWKTQLECRNGRKAPFISMNKTANLLLSCLTGGKGQMPQEMAKEWKLKVRLIQWISWHWLKYCASGSEEAWFANTTNSKQKLIDGNCSSVFPLGCDLSSSFKAITEAGGSWKEVDQRWHASS